MQRLWDNYTAPWRDFGAFTGRATRAEFWTFTLANVVVSWALSSLDILVGVYSSEYGVGILSGLFGLAIFIPGIAVTVRRLHDSNLSGWWMLILFVPLVGVIVNLIQMLLAGNRGPNRFGLDPRGEIVVPLPTDGGPPFADSRGRFTICPWCRQSNPPGRDSCQWCHKPYREPHVPA